MARSPPGRTESRRKGGAAPWTRTACREPVEIRQPVGHEGEDPLRCELIDLLDPVEGSSELVLVLFAGRGHQLRRREERENGRERHQYAVHGYRGGGEPGEVELHVAQVQIAVGIR